MYARISDRVGYFGEKIPGMSIGESLAIEIKADRVELLEKLAKKLPKHIKNPTNDVDMGWNSVLLEVHADLEELINENKRGNSSDAV